MVVYIQDYEELEEIVRSVLQQHADFRLTEGKKVQYN